MEPFVESRRIGWFVSRMMTSPGPDTLIA